MDKNPTATTIPPPVLIDPDDAAREEEDVVPSLWRRGKRQGAFLFGLVWFAFALALGAASWTDGAAGWTAGASACLVAALISWAFARQYHGPVFTDVELGARRAPGTIRVAWRSGEGGRRPGGSGELRTDGGEIVIVHLEPFPWDFLAMAGIALGAAFVIAGPRGLEDTMLEFVIAALAVAALRTFGLPRQRRVERRIAAEHIARADLVGARFFVRIGSADADALIFDTRELSRMRTRAIFETLLPARFFIDAHVRPGQTIPRRDRGEADLAATAERLRRLSDDHRPTR